MSLLMKRFLVTIHCYFPNYLKVICKCYVSDTKYRLQSRIYYINICVKINIFIFTNQYKTV